MMRCLRTDLLVPLSILAVAGAPLQAQDAAVLREQEIALRQQIRELEADLIQRRAEGIEAIEVNGVKLSPLQVRREAVFLAGANQIEAKIANFFIDEWMERAVEEGRNRADFEISEQKIVADLKDQVAQFQEQNPGAEFWDAVRSMTGLSRDGYLEQARHTELFNKVFFPGPAEQWPSITKEAIIASAGGGSGKQFWDNMVNSTKSQNGQIKELPVFWMFLCRGWVQKQLKMWSDIRYPADGLPPEIVLSVNGRTWETEEAFERVKTGVFVQDLERAMIEVVGREALRQALEKAGAMMSDDGFREEYDVYRQQYDSTPFTTEVIAKTFKGYPSLEAFRQRWRLMRSFEKMIAKDINDDNLQAHADRYVRFFKDGQTDVDVIPFLAKSVKTNAWQPDGFAGARQRAVEAFEAISGGASFDDTLEQRGEFFAKDPERGRLGNKALNQIRQSLRESEFTDLLMGYSIGTYLFYDAEQGKVVGPLRGPEGYYIARVNNRLPARGTVDVKDERMRELVRQDYVTHRFMAWANEVLSRVQIN
jgi:hypothetical protein